MHSQQTLPRKLRIEVIPLHIDRFQEGGKWFAKAREFGVVTHGDSEVEAINHALNMVTRSVFVAATNGNLPQVLKQAGVTIRVGFPESDETKTEEGLWYVSLTSSANNLSAS